MKHLSSDNSFFRWTRKHAQSFFQKLMLTSSLFFKNDLLYQAAASAFFFLLSISPILLLLLLTFNTYLASYPNISRDFFAFLTSINSNIDRELLSRIGLINDHARAMGLLGSINLLWAGCWILTAIQKGLEIVFKSEKRRTTLVMYVLSLLTLTLMLGVAFLVAVVSIAFNFFQAMVADSLFFQKLISSFMPVLRNLLPFLSSFSLIFLSYRFVPGTKPTTLSSLKGALWCTLAVLLMHLVMARFLNVTRLNIIYGVLGSLILLLLWVHFTFVLYFFFAQYTYVSDNIDTLTIGRMYSLLSRPVETGRTIEKFLFKHPKRVFEKYARYYQPGETIFRQGDDSTDIFYLYRGKVNIYRQTAGNQQQIAAMGPGEVFGEMAYLLDERRMASAVSETEATILVVGVAIFEELLQADQRFARDIIQQLSSRLKMAHLHKNTTYSVT